MAKKANKVAIGGFVVAAISLFIISLVVFGSGKFFKQKHNFVMYFGESISGLNVGSPVRFQGVEIGSVKSVDLVADLKTLVISRPVVIETLTKRFQLTEESDRMPPDVWLPKAIEKGFRAKLVIQSYITGNLGIELDFFPNTPVVLKQTDLDMHEIPTLPSSTARFSELLNELDLKKAGTDLSNILSGLNRVINDPKLQTAITGLNDLLNDANRFVQHLDAEVDPLSDKAMALMSDIDSMTKDAQAKIDPLSETLTMTLTEYAELAKQVSARIDPLITDLEKTLASVRNTLHEDSPMLVELEVTLQEISAAARTLREFVRGLEEQPESVLQGKRQIRR